ncbi:MAG: hypothetical protein A2X82_09395 [Geobacteraceae bacterium GWC2_55_20]|nr:MAG: hypothetical protein A2X82_09395 [Geobacteraceae bacterium GWC2_55_20]OGU19230.1 MAG: hypothetical protein A2X85_12900 [Geobacteraceae bacterium GWF2_54_21]
MNSKETKNNEPVKDTAPRENVIYTWVSRTLVGVVALEWLLLLLNQSWLSLFLVTIIMVALISPTLFRRKLDVEIPVEFHITAVIFIFASLYLGEIQSFYQRFWWWDIALHSSAGLLMGILGFLLVYLLNESKRVELHMTPVFISVFAFIFAVTIGTLWEIFEFFMDQLFALNMQKPMLGDPSGLTDTMWDMIVNAIGAFIISFIGWWYLKRKQTFFVRDWIRTFIQKNPALFDK